MPEPNKHDIMFSIKYRDQNNKKPLLYKKEDYMCTDNCNQPLDKNISYDDVDNTYCLIEKEDCISNEYEKSLGETTSYNDNDI